MNLYFLLLLSALSGVFADKLSISTTCNYFVCNTICPDTGVKRFWDCYFTVTIGDRTWGDFPTLTYIGCSSFSENPRGPVQGSSLQMLSGYNYIRQPTKSHTLLGTHLLERRGLRLPSNRISSQSSDGAIWVGRADPDSWCDIGEWIVRINYAGQQHTYTIKEGYAKWFGEIIFSNQYIADQYYGYAGGYFPPNSGPAPCFILPGGNGLHDCCVDDNSCNSGRSCRNKICVDLECYVSPSRNDNGVCCRNGNDCKSGSCNGNTCQPIQCGRGDGKGDEGSCCGSVRDCRYGCFDGQCTGKSCLKSRWGIGDGDGGADDCCRDSEDCHESCKKGMCTPMYSCDRDLGQEDGVLGDCCESSNDCAITCDASTGKCRNILQTCPSMSGNAGSCCRVSKDCKSGKCPLGVCVGGAVSTTTLGPVPTNNGCIPGWCGRGIGEGPIGACCSVEGDCDDTCNGNGKCGKDDGTWRAPLRCPSDATKSTTVTKTTSAIPTTTGSKTCKSGYYGKGLKNGPDTYCCATTNDCAGSCVYIQGDSYMCTGSATATTTTASTPTPTHLPCFEGMRNTNLSLAVGGYCCNGPKDCAGQCVNGVCTSVSNKICTGGYEFTSDRMSSAGYCCLDIADSCAGDCVDGICTEPITTPCLTCKQGHEGDGNGNLSPEYCCSADADCLFGCSSGTCAIGSPPTCSKPTKTTSTTKPTQTGKPEPKNVDISDIFVTVCSAGCPGPPGLIVGIFGSLFSFAVAFIPVFGHDDTTTTTTTTKSTSTSSSKSTAATTSTTSSATKSSSYTTPGSTATTVTSTTGGTTNGTTANPTSAGTSPTSTMPNNTTVPTSTAYGNGTTISTTLDNTTITGTTTPIITTGIISISKNGTTTGDTAIGTNTTTVPSGTITSGTISSSGTISESATTTYGPSVVSTSVATRTGTDTTTSTTTTGDSATSNPTSSTLKSQTTTKFVTTVHTTISPTASTAVPTGKTCKSGYYNKNLKNAPDGSCCATSGDCIGSCVYVVGDSYMCEDNTTGISGITTGISGITTGISGITTGISGITTGIVTTPSVTNITLSIATSVTTSTTSSPPKPTPTCTTGYCGKGLGKGPIGACCADQSDCDDTCNANGKCGVSDETWTKKLACP